MVLSQRRTCPKNARQLLSGHFMLAGLFEVMEGALAFREILECKQHFGIANAEAVTIGKDGLGFDLLAVDEDAIMAAHINRIVAFFFAVVADLHMLAGDLLVDDLYWDRCISADYIASSSQRIVLDFAIRCHNKDGGHSSSLPMIVLRNGYDSRAIHRIQTQGPAVKSCQQ